MAEMMPRGADTPEQMIRAKDLVAEALRLLDDAGAPADIGAHLDSGLQRLIREIDQL